MESTFLSAICLLDDIFAELEWETDQDKHTECCKQWYRDFGHRKWACEQPMIETGGYLDPSQSKCKFINILDHL